MTTESSSPISQPSLDLKPIITPSPPRCPDLSKKLKKAYSVSNELPMPLSERSFPIQPISLTTKELQLIKDEELTASPVKYPEEKKDKKSTTGKALEFGEEQLAREAAWHRIEKPIAIEDIFKRTQTGVSENPIKIEDKKSSSKTDTPSGESVKRVLIEGRAGVGKTTLVQHIAHQWAKGLFNQDYDYLLWVPLRQWLHGQKSSAPTNLAESLAAFLHQHYKKALAPESLQEQELETVLGNDGNNRTLLVLDGFDEVAHFLNQKYINSVPGKLLDQALRFPQVIVTTRDYQLPPSGKEYAFDNTLVNIGFSDKQIARYIKEYAAWRNDSSTSDCSSTFIKTLRQNPQLWALAHIPLNLALICQIKWRNTSHSIRSSNREPDNLSSLYQKMVARFLLQELGKHPERLKNPDVLRCHILQILTEYFVVEWDALCTLAWMGFTHDQNKVILSGSMQQDLRCILAEHHPEQKSQLVSYCSQAFNLGLLRSQDPSNPDLFEQERYFIHFTFQEYLTAHY